MDKKNSHQKYSKQDQGWAWVVLAAAAFNLCIVLGISLGSGVYVAEVIRNWDVTKANAALLGSVLYGIMFCFGPITTYLATKTSNRTMVIVGGILSATGLVISANVRGLVPLYCTFSVMGGIGNGIVFLQSIVMANLYFRKYRGLASGITLAGGGFGLLFVPLMERWIITHYTWQPSLYIVAGICLHTIVAGALMRPVKLPLKSSYCQNEDSMVFIERGKSLCYNKIFILFCISSFIWGLGITVPIILGEDFYYETGMNGFQTNILLSCFGVGNLLGRLVGGIICNIKRLDKLLISVISTCSVAVNVGLFAAPKEFILLAVIASSFGCTFGIFIVAHTVTSASIVETSKIEKAITISYFVNGIGLVMGPPIAGALYDLTASYRWPFLVASAIIFLSAAVLVPGFWCKRQSTAITLVVEN